jgi:predicted small lipoprotein YifL
MLKFNRGTKFKQTQDRGISSLLLNAVLVSISRPKIMQKKTALILIRITLLITICYSLNSCGTKGPLYIPERQYPQDTPAKN